MTVRCAKGTYDGPDECCGECGAVHPLVIPGELDRREIIDHFSAELEHSEKWVLIHKAQGQLEAANRRREHCKKLLRWLEWLHLQESTVAAERERCARIAEGVEKPEHRHWVPDSLYDTLRRETAAEIRKG